MTPAPPEAYAVHRSPGRLRLKIPDRKGDTAYFARLAAGIGACPGVRSTRVNPATASILVLHHGDAEGVIAFGRDGDLFTFPRRFFAPPRPASSNGLRMAELAAFALAGLGVMQLFRGNALGPAAGLFWMALSIARGAMAEPPNGDEAAGN